jgi:hypothetical protein
MKFRTFWLMGACALLFAGCDDSSSINQHADQRSGLTQSQAQPGWLDPTSDIDPAGWLISREASRGKTVKAEEADIIKASIANAAKIFKEDPRMIANRAVQLEVMLDPTDDRETAVWLVEVLTDVVREPGRVEGFGAIGQQYFNLRKSGLSERAALDDLTRRYRSRG